jgi:hypothetical protein
VQEDVLDAGRDAFTSDATSDPNVFVAASSASGSRPATFAVLRTLVGVRRYQAAAVFAIAAAAIPYLWVLWDLWTGTINPLRLDGADDNPIYDVQARAIMHGHLRLANGSIGTEAFVHDGRTYTYFGIFPSLLRVPFFLFTHALDGRFTSLSLLGAWLVTAVFSALLLWRLRVLLRGDAPLGWSEAASYGVLLGSILVGSVLVFLASIPDVYSEDEAWSVALACASLFALMGVFERPSWRRVITCGVLVLLTNLNRSTTGYAAVLSMVLIALWFASGRAGPMHRRWALPLALTALFPLLAGCAIDAAKFGILFGVPYADYTLGKALGYDHINGGQYFGLRYLPSTLQAYVDPANFRIRSIFPFITLPDNPSGEIAHTQLLARGATANVPVSMPLLFLFGLWGVVTAFSQRWTKAFGALRILIITSAASAGAMMIYSWIYERYVADFIPLLVLTSMIGMVDVWRRLDGRSRAARIRVPAVIGLLALFGLWANLGFAVTPDTDWSHTQLTHYIAAQKAVSDITGHPLDGYVVVGARCSGKPSRRPLHNLDCEFPHSASSGTLFVRRHCAQLYVAVQGVPAGAYFPSSIWSLVERAPHTSLCRSLVG